jgi:hypothetical protein
VAKLVELDWSGIEAVIVGWLSRDPNYIRLAWLGVHDFLCSHAVGKPASLDWPIDELLRYFAEIKKAFPEERDQAKRIVHGSNYLESAVGIYKRFRKLFKSLRDAERLQELYYSIAPRLRPWQLETVALAAKQEFIGGAGVHPFCYRHEFYDVYNYRLITKAEAIKLRRLGRQTTEMNGRPYAIVPGEDAKRAVAFGPQSIAAGIIRKTARLLYTPGLPNFIGDLFHGQTPLRAIIHDSFLNEPEDQHIDRLIERSWREMTRPFEELPLPLEWGLGPYLQFGVEVKIGQDWQSMVKRPVPQPWLALLKGRPDDPQAMLLDFGGSSVVDEEVDPETIDDDYTPTDVFEFGGGRDYSGGSYASDDVAF